MIRALTRATSVRPCQIYHPYCLQSLLYSTRVPREDIKIATDDYDFTNSFKTLSVQEKAIPDSSLPHAYLMGSETYGQVVKDFHYDTNFDEEGRVNIIDYEDHVNEYREEPQHQQAEQKLTSEESRLHPDVLKGRVNRRQIKIPDAIAKTINNKILIHQEPKKLRIKASKIFVELNETGIQQPSRDTGLEVDANIASFFTQNYGEVYQPLYELKKRLGEAWAPTRVLEVGYGPATGMIALNEMMGDSFAPEVKHSFIIGSYEMQKRAKVLLSRQPCEQNGLDQDQRRTEFGEDILEGSDLVRHDTGASHEINTKKIKIKTKLLSYVPETATYDLIILSHQLLTSFEGFPLEVDEVLDEYLSKLSPGGHIVLVERGSPLGFETIARARQITMRPENHQNSNSKTPRLYIRGSAAKPKNNAESGAKPDFYLRVVAPCSHHGECPLQLKKLEPYTYGGNLNKKINWCHFTASIQRPRFLMELKKGRLMGAEWDSDNLGIAPPRTSSVGSGRSFSNDYERVSYSYLILQRTLVDEATLQQIEAAHSTQHPIGTVGTTADDWPRLMKTPLKKKGMVVAEVCGASGKLEKWIIPKSFGKQAYHDARKAQEGDLWPLGAKTKMESSRNSYKLVERMETKEANIKKKAKMDRKLEKKLARQKIENKQFELDQMEPNEDNLSDRIENMGLQMALKFKDVPKFKKFKQGKYKY